MSWENPTRSLIMEEVSKGRYVAILCTYDGYLTHNGALLIDFYNERQRVDRLMQMGDLLTLGAPEGIKDKGAGTCSQLNGGLKPAWEVSMWEAEAFPCNAEVVYVYTLNGVWRYMTPGDHTLRSVISGLDEIYKGLGFKRPKDYYGFWTDLSAKEARGE